MNPEESSKGPVGPDNNNSNPRPSFPQPSQLPQASPTDAYPAKTTGSIYPNSANGVYAPTLETAAYQTNSKRPKKKLLLILPAVILPLLLGVGYVLGFYIPNKPENVWKTGLERSGNAIDQIVSKTTETEKLNQIKNSEITGSLEFSSDNFNFNGNLVSKLNETKSDSNLDIAFQDNTGQERKLNFKALTDLDEGNKYPDVFFQFSGIKQLGLDAFVPGLSEYEGKWIGVESGYLEKLSEYDGSSKAQDNQKNITSEEYAEIVRTVSETSKEYLFASDPENAVLENRGFVGKEEIDGQKTYHYEASINETNAKKFCVILSERVIVLPAWQKLFELNEESTQKMKDDAKKSCEEQQSKNSDDDGVFDVWVDGKYKLIYKIRDFTDKDKKNYFEVGQNYKGGDDVSFFVNTHDDISQFDFRFELAANLETNITKINLNADQKARTDTNALGPFKAKASFEAKPLEGEINTDKPEGTIKLQDILESFGVNSASGDSFLAG